VFGAAAVEEARTRPAIRHFEGPSLNKPWHYLGDAAMQDAYMAFRRRTPWPEVDMEDRTPATRLIRRLPEQRRTPAYLRLLRLRRRFPRLATPGTRWR